MSKPKYPSVTLRLSEDELAHLKWEAKLAGLSVSAFLRHLATNRQIMPHQRVSDMKYLSRHLSSIGNNLNQLARHANRRRGLTDNDALAEELAGIRTQLERMTWYVNAL